jgi:hypothetical protein
MTDVKPDFPLLNNEVNRFYGLRITAADVTFKLDSKLISARSELILAGSNYVAGKIIIPGIKNGTDTFVLEKSGMSIGIKSLQRELEEKGFYRINIKFAENHMSLAFYTEK